MTHTPRNRLAGGCSSSDPLGAGETFLGASEVVSGHQAIAIMCYTDAAGTLHIDQSVDKENWDLTKSFTVAAGVANVFRDAIVGRWCRVRLVNGATPQSVLRMLTTLQEDPSQASSGINDDISDASDAVLTRSVLTGQLDSGAYTNVGANVEGALKVMVRGPNSVFGEVLSVEPTPVAQMDFVQGRFNGATMRTVTYGTGTVRFADSMANLSVGATPFDYAYIRTRRALRYRPGQGAAARFSAIFDTPVANSIQLAGPYGAETGFAVGYSGTSFCFLHRRAGKTAIHRLTIDQAGTSTATAFLVLSGATFPVAITNAASNKSKTAWEIGSLSSLEPNFWSADPVTPTTGSPYVEFAAQDVGAKNGVFSFSGGGVSASFSTVREGTAASEGWIPQSQWNIDPMDGTGPSGQVINPQKGNVFEVAYQYLGFGAIVLGVEHTEDGEIQPVHRIRYANTGTMPSIENPTLPVSFVAGSLGSTTSLTFKTASAAAFVQGPVRRLGVRRSRTVAVSSVGTTNVPIMTIRNPWVVADRRNHIEVFLVSLSASAEGTRPGIITLVTGSILAGAPTFTPIDNTSVVQVDTTATSYTNGIERFALTMAKASSTQAALDDLEIILSPGQEITVAARAQSGTIDVAIALSWVED